MKQKIDIRAIVKKDQKILLLKNVDGQAKFQLPGGVLDFGSDPRGFLQEDIQQKLGQTVQVMQLADVRSFIEAPQVQTLAITFLVSLLQQGHAPEDSTKYIWKKLSDIQPLEVDDFTAELLQLKTKNYFTDTTQDDRSSIVDNSTTNIHKEVIVYTDGGSRGNPGPSAAGFVILGGNDEELLFEGGKYLGITTNNQAEYQAVKLGLEKALELGARTVKFRMDSLLIVNQMIGVYQIKNRDLWPIYASIKELIKKFDSVSFTHVRREFNKEADALVNKVLDEQASGN